MFFLLNNNSDNSNNILVPRTTAAYRTRPTPTVFCAVPKTEPGPPDDRLSIDTFFTGGFAFEKDWLYPGVSIKRTVHRTRVYAMLSWNRKRRRKRSWVSACMYTVGRRRSSITNRARPASFSSDRFDFTLHKSPFVRIYNFFFHPGWKSFITTHRRSPGNRRKPRNIHACGIRVI